MKKKVQLRMHHQIRMKRKQKLLLVQFRNQVKRNLRKLIQKLKKRKRKRKKSISQLKLRWKLKLLRKRN